MCIQRDAQAGVLKLSQESFVTEVLRRFNLSGCKPAPTPAVDGGTESEMAMLTSEEDKEAISDLPFLEVIGCLWWLAQMTRICGPTTRIALGGETLNEPMAHA